MTAHDGFTLNDLVSYNEKHNEANGEDNRDGESHNRSWNCGVEGPTDDGEVNALRERQKRNFLATLLLSQGVPMIAHGDELGRTQQGNNNVYCQDNELSWIDWDDAREHDVLTEFTARARRAARASTRCSGGGGSSRAARSSGSSIDDIAWLRPDGQHDDRRGLERRPRQHAMASSSTATASRTATRSASGSSTTRSCCCSTPTTSRSRSPLPDRDLRADLGDRRRHRRPAAGPHPTPPTRARQPAARPGPLDAGPAVPLLT